MSERYQIICPDCRVVLSQKEVPKVCPQCKQDITDSYEILFQPGAQSTIAKRVALVILVVITVILIVALVSAFL